MIPVANVEIAPTLAGSLREGGGFFAWGDAYSREIWLLDNGWVRLHPADGTFPRLFPPQRVVEARHMTSSGGELLVAEDFA